MVVMEKTFGDTCKPNLRTVELDSGELTFLFDDEPETDKNISIDVQKFQIVPKIQRYVGSVARIRMHGRQSSLFEEHM